MCAAATTRGADLSERYQISNELGDAQYILADNPHLQRVHSAASIRSVLKKSGVPLARADDAAGRGAGLGTRSQGGGGGGDGHHHEEYHVPDGMVNGTDILFRARNHRMHAAESQPSPQKQQQQEQQPHWMKIDEMSSDGGYGAAADDDDNNNNNAHHSPSKVGAPQAEPRLTHELETCLFSPNSSHQMIDNR